MVMDPTDIYKFNASRDILSHSTTLTNQRISYMFLKLDACSMDMNQWLDSTYIESTFATLFQIWKNVRCFFSNHPNTRKTLKMDTEVDGVYTMDLLLQTANKMLLNCRLNGYTVRKNYIIANILNQGEEMLRSYLQYFHYFIRSTERQKPDISEAAEFWKNKADEKTVQELIEITGKKNKRKFEDLGDYRIKETPQDDE